MTETTVTAPAPSRHGEQPAITDCDIHNGLATRDQLKPYLASGLHAYYDQLPGRNPSSGFYTSRPHASIFREDSWPAEGGVPGSSLELMREQLLDHWNVARGILSPLDTLGWPQQGEFGAALVRGLNDWTIDAWLDQEPRLHGSISITTEDSDRAVAEIERLGGHPRFVQVLMLARTHEPLGHPKYHPIYEAAAAHGLPVTIHVGGSGHPLTGSGWPSYHIETHIAFVQAYVAHVTSIVHSGICDRLPALQFVLAEGGFAWVPALMGRLDRAWSLMRDAVPHLQRPPSATIREHFWFTTQPMDEAPDPEHFMEMLGQLDMDARIMFATDYPHWDFDAPNRALPRPMEEAFRERILMTNAQALFPFGETVLA